MLMTLERENGEFSVVVLSAGVFLRAEERAEERVAEIGSERVKEIVSFSCCYKKRR